MSTFGKMNDKQRLTGRKAIRRCAEVLGSKAEIARIIGVHRSTISAWEYRGYVPKSHVIDLEKATGGKVSRHELNPAAYPKE